jgi:hypothetical protein
MPAGLTQTGGLSQVRIYEQLMTMRQRMSVRLSESNRYARFLEAELDVRTLPPPTPSNPPECQKPVEAPVPGVSSRI